MLHLASLPDHTRRLLALLLDDADISSFTLIGGTALTLHHAHRQSEDLDFAWAPKPGEHDATSLDRSRTDAILDRLRSRGLSVETAFDQSAFDEATNMGVDLLDSHQDWLVDGVKLTFFAPDTPAEAERLRTYPVVDMQNVRLLSSDALFESKSRLLARRGLSRDLFDIWFFLTHENKTLEQVFAFVRDQSTAYDDELAKKRLLPTAQRPLDPGYHSILDHGPKAFHDLVAALTDLVADYEIRETERLVLGERPAIR